MKAIKMIKEGFTARQVYVLEQLLECDRTATQIASDLFSRQHTKIITDNLEVRGFIKRKQCVDDGRQVILSITDEGRSVLSE